jgi:hypothetical protein
MRGGPLASGCPTQPIKARHTRQHARYHLLQRCIADVRTKPLAQRHPAVVVGSLLKDTRAGAAACWTLSIAAKCVLFGAVTNSRGYSWMVPCWMLARHGRAPSKVVRV